MFTPKFSAYLVPSKRALSGFTMRSEAKRTKITDKEKIDISSLDTPEKLPMPHITNECTPSSVAKKLSRDIALDVR